MEMLGDLESLQFDYEMEEKDRNWLYLLGRSRGLMIKACAHATFFCKLLHKLRQSLCEKQTCTRPSSGSLDDTPGDDELKVGILGGGHLGKQLARVLLQLVPVPAERLRISTRRPEALDEFQKLGIQCSYRNASLAGWADVLFLCCLPSQLPHICSEIHSSLDKACVVYSFVAAVPVPRLKLLLRHTNILRPQYQCFEGFANIWGASQEIIVALQNPELLQATCPYSAAGGIIVSVKWLEGVFYAALNICTATAMPYPRVLRLLNELFLCAHPEACGRDGAQCPRFQLQDFVSSVYAKSLSPKRPLPWFDLTVVQLRETPFSEHLSGSPALQDHLTSLYCAALGISPAREPPATPPGSASE